MINNSYNNILERLSTYGIGDGAQIIQENDYTLTEAQLGSFYYNAIVSEAFDELMGSDDIVVHVNEAGNNREMASLLNDAFKQYKSALRQSREYTKKKDYKNAIACVEKARKSLKETEKAIEAVPGSALTTIKGWILSYLIKIVKNFVPCFMVRNGISRVTVDATDDNQSSTDEVWRKAFEELDATWDRIINSYNQMMEDDDYVMEDPDYDWGDLVEEGGSLVIKLGRSLNSFKKETWKSLNALGKIGAGLQCINSFISTVTNIYGIAKTIVDKGTVGQAINTFRSKILMIMASMDKTLALYEKDLTRKANKAANK